MNNFELEIEILLTLASGSELDATEIMNRLNRKLGKNWLRMNKVGIGNLYPALYRLEKNKEISRRLEVTEGKENRKAYYRLTLNGGNRITDINSNILFAF